MISLLLWFFLQKSTERDLMIDWKEHFLTYLKGSAYYTGATEETKHIHSRFYLENSVC